MNTLRNLIKESLQGYNLKKKSCSCGCNTCEDKRILAPILNESIAPREILSEGLKYHIDNNKPLTEHVYRAGSQNYFDLWSEARALYSRGIIDIKNQDDLEILEKAELYSDDAFNKTDNIYNFPNGSYIEFFGAEDSGKVRGPGRDILYINEANLLSQSIYQQLAFRTRKTIFLDFNPVDESSWVYDVADKDGNLLIHSTYKDNPFLPKEQVNEIESLKEADANLWKVYGLGERGTSQEIIYTHWKQGEFPEGCEVVYGLDFGYSVPTAMVKVGFKDGKTYVEEMIYQTKLTTSDLAERLKDLGISNYVEIFCDNAEPKTIEELTRAGFNAKPASKDVYAGIQKVKSQPLIISPSSVNLIKEIRSYRWKVDKDGKIHQVLLLER